MDRVTGGGSDPLADFVSGSNSTARVTSVTKGEVLLCSENVEVTHDCLEPGTSDGGWASLRTAGGKGPARCWAFSCRKKAALEIDHKDTWSHSHRLRFSSLFRSQDPPTSLCPAPLKMPAGRMLDEFGRDEYGLPGDKQWASKYLLEPLYEPEPSQVCATRFTPLPPSPPSSTKSSTTPIHSAVGSIRRKFQHTRNPSYTEGDEEEQPFLRRLLSRTSSIRSTRSTLSLNKHLPPSPPAVGRTLSNRSAVPSRPAHSRNWSQGTILSRTSSVATSPSNLDSTPDSSIARSSKMSNQFPPSTAFPTTRNRSSSLNHPPPPSEESFPIRRGNSLRLKDRYPGDQSHRPLAMIASDHRAANRHARSRPASSHNRPYADPIDQLDQSSPFATYHHSGPYDPTLIPYNTNKKYSPLEAVKSSNNEAIKATPVEFVKDSLEKHVPLQGTAVVPPGERDFLTGRRMGEYEEGADLMREPSAGGGAYKRWPGVEYREGDLKGKGEGWYTGGAEEEARRAAKQRGGYLARSISGDGKGGVYEMQPQRGLMASGSEEKNGNVRQRQRVVDEEGSYMLPEQVEEEPYHGGLERSKSGRASGGLGGKLRRKIGSLRGRKERRVNEDYY
ncbi:hypothetical protein QBC40DRAFT_294776 [Triangularia verruculosa]|uniref:Uncharacterized protein n=1 Tax=Triangularia verruculosa TaxID=2587418 RepID=A0AAN7AZ30_9PEZI|nr:hypothetical protein QBC40DRAFT_294776 [Triangularia verruculosa]